MSKKLDAVIVIALPVMVTFGWCTLVWKDPDVSLENKGYKHPDPITVDEPNLFLDLKTISTVNVSASTREKPTPTPTPKKMKPAAAADAVPTDWHDDPALDDLIGSCGKRHCDCSDTFESCESDIDCCNGYDACIENKCKRYEDY